MSEHFVVRKTTICCVFFAGKGRLIVLLAALLGLLSEDLAAT